MTHKSAPTLTAEQNRFEEFWRNEKPAGYVGFSRDANGYYHTEFLRDAWNAWQAAIGGQSKEIGGVGGTCMTYPELEAAVEAWQNA